MQSAKATLGLLLPVIGATMGCLAMRYLSMWALGLLLLGACTEAQGPKTTQGPDSADPNLSAAKTPTPAPTPEPLPSQPNVVAPQPAQGANVRMLGRTDSTTDAQGPLIAWPGSAIVVGFSGTQLTVDLVEMDRETYGGQSVNNYFTVSIDGVPGSRIKLSATAQSYLVASNLPRGQHQVVLIKSTEAQMGRVQFRGAQTDGTLTYTSAPSVRRLEFVGDSGTAGYGVLGTPPCTFSAATEDASVAYPNVVGTLLGAEVRNLSFSGKGLVQNRDMQNDNEKMLPVLWARTLPNDQNETPYTPQGWAPQAVIMTIGGNDFYAQVLDQTTFVAAVTRFMKTVMATYPSAHIYLGLSPMLRDDAHPNQRESGLRYAQAAVAGMNSAQVHYLDLPADLGANGYGCDEHMSAATHKLQAGVVAQVLRTQFGW